jgi:hypothetical protein
MISLKTIQSEFFDRIDNMSLIGTWHIYEMENWDEDYFNMEVQAYITIDKNHNGEFQFGLVHGVIYGEPILGNGAEELEFEWRGNDECDPASGTGWIRMNGKDEIEGEFTMHYGDESEFRARRARK